MIIFCIASGVIGAVFGYILNWALRHNPKPDAKEVIALVGMLAGGVIVQLIKEDLFGCREALAWYLIGAFIGFFIFILALRRGWDNIKSLINQGKLAGVPFLPFKFW